MVQSGDADCVDHLDWRWLGGGSTPPPVSYPPGAPRGQHPGWLGRWRLASDLWWATLARACAAGDGMRAVIFLAARELRARWRGWAVLVLLVAVAGGAVLAAAAGARRTASAYPRFLTASRASDLFVAPDLYGFGGYFGALARLPGAGAVVPVAAFDLELPGHGGAAALNSLNLAFLERRFGRVLEVPKVLAGRLPAADRAGEIAIDQRGAAMAARHRRIAADLIGQWLPAACKPRRAQ